jgi:hypothetical protein
MCVSPTPALGNAATVMIFTSGAWSLPPPKVLIPPTLGVGKPWYVYSLAQYLCDSDKIAKCPKFGPVFIKPANPQVCFSAAVQTSFHHLNAIYEAHHVHCEARANALALPVLLELEDAGLLVPPAGESPDSVVPPTPSPPSSPTPAPRYGLRKGAKQKPSRRILESVESAYRLVDLLTPEEVPVPIVRGRSPSAQQVQMNLHGCVAAADPISQLFNPWPKDGPSDGLTLLDKAPQNARAKAHCKFYYLVSINTCNLPFLPAQGFSDRKGLLSKVWLSSVRSRMEGFS